MAFVNEENRVPSSIGRIEIREWDDGQGGQGASYYYEVLDQFGGILHQRRGNAAPHLLPGEIADSQARMVRVRGLAESSLPTP
jgi:hypothetical protein